MVDSFDEHFSELAEYDLPSRFIEWNRRLYLMMAFRRGMRRAC
jgi:hypothetical protein